MLSRTMKLAGIVAMTLALALGGSAALVGTEAAAHSVAQGEGPATPRA